MSEEPDKLIATNQELLTANNELVKKVVSEEEQKASLVQSNDDLAREVAKKESQKVNFIQFTSTIATALTLAAISWLVTSTHANSEKLARIDERMTIMGETRYTSNDAIKDFALLQVKINALEVRIDRQTDRIERAELSLINANTSRKAEN